MTGMQGPHALSGRFLKAYNKLDDSLRRDFQTDRYESHSVLLSEKAAYSVDFRQSLYELKRFADLRNSIVHWFGAARGTEAIAEPHEEIVVRYERLVQSVLRPVKAQAIAVPKSKIYTATLDDSTVSVIREMYAQVYTHVPILENRRLVGVFSENTVLSYLAVNEIVGVDPTIKIRAFRDFIPLQAHTSETFAFIPRNALFGEVVALFRKNLATRKRLGAVFITANGKDSEDLLGLITAWDIAGADPMRDPEWS
jgi:CBS domain-containing protein